MSSQIAKSNSSLYGGFVLALLILLIARSSLAPTFVSMYAPILASLVVVVSCFLNRRIYIPSRIWLLISFSFIMVFSSLLNGDLNKSFQAFGIYLLWLLAVLVGANLSHHQWAGVYKLLVCVGIVQTLVAIGETILGLEWVRMNIAADTSGAYLIRANLLTDLISNRAQGTVGYPIPFSHLIAISFIIVVLGNVIKRPFVRISVAVTLMGGVFLSGTRSALIAILLAIAVHLIYQQGKRGKGLRFFFLASGALVGAFMALRFLFVASELSDYSFVHRLGVVSSIDEIVSFSLRQFLVGSGYNSHELLFENGVIPGMFTYAVDNAFVSIIISGGVVGFGLFVWVLAASIPTMDALGRAILVLSIVYGFSYDFVFWHLLMFLTMAVVGRGMAGSIEELSRERLISSPTLRV